MLSWSYFFYLHIIGVERCCCRRSHSVTHTHTQAHARTRARTHTSPPHTQHTHTHAHTHTHTPHTHSVGVSGRGIGLSQGSPPDKTQHTQQTDTHDPVGIRTRNPSKRGNSNWRLRTRGHRYRLHFNSVKFIYVLSQQSDSQWQKQHELRMVWLSNI